MRNLKITLQYDGTNYVGWQRQASGTSIQGLLEDAIEPIAGTRVTVHGAGRTDAGVHAVAQVASVAFPGTHESAVLVRAFNAVLPPDVRVLSVEDVQPDFHARFSAVGKIYEYRIVNGPIVSPFLVRYAWHVSYPINVDAMKAASMHLAGAHDFTAFQGASSDVGSSLRTIRSIDWASGHGHDVPLVVQIQGDGFLRHMVRNIVGTLIEIGVGRWTSDKILEILASRDRSRAGPTAPARGLFLVQVEYPPE
ncbi:MAG: tRNA pseudouridine(38-40) synthase TruA [Vicinamibacterales bacterium]